LGENAIVGDVYWLPAGEIKDPDGNGRGWLEALRQVGAGIGQGCSVWAPGEGKVVAHRFGQEGVGLAAVGASEPDLTAWRPSFLIQELAAKGDPAACRGPAG
jgi:hypothetical protein